MDRERNDELMAEAHSLRKSLMTLGLENAANTIAKLLEEIGDLRDEISSNYWWDDRLRADALAKMREEQRTTASGTEAP